MGSNLRKLLIWSVSLGVVAGIYLLYNRVSRTPRIDIGMTADVGGVADSNMGRPGSEIGKIGDVGVADVEVARFITRNKNKTVSRELGFRRLLYDRGDEWEIERPYMNIFRRALKCRITADTGNVLLEPGVDRPSPKDVTLTGNVVIHFLPGRDSRARESFIYLDDITFISEKSQFSTAGPVRFVSQDAQMQGRGLELVYNGETDRLEFLRIIHLEKLSVKQSSQANLFSRTKQDGRQRTDDRRQTAGDRSGEPRTAGSRAQTGNVRQSLLPAVTVAAAVTVNVKQSPPQGSEAVEQKNGEYYKCLFSKDVVIDCPEQLIFADEVSINNIFWQKGSGDRTDETEPAPGAGTAATVQQGSVHVTEETVTSAHNDANTVGAIDVNVPDTIVAPEQNRQGESQEQFVDIVVTCGNGILVTPMDSPLSIGDFAGLEPSVGAAEGRIENLNNAKGRPTLVARHIDYNAPGGDTVASGPLEVTFYVNDIDGVEPNRAAVPVKVTARKKAEFTPALNQVIFEGDCLCTMFKADANVQRKYILSAPRFTVNLSGGNTRDIEHFTADGGIVRLATVKTAGEELLGGIELKCSRFDYDTGQQKFLAAGAGVIKVDNSSIVKPKGKVDKFSLRKPCYVVVRNFNTLEYLMQAGRVTADAKSERILIDYIPVVAGGYGQQISAAAGHIDALLYETADGKSELSTLTAADGITYEEKDIEFAGSELFYQADKSFITVKGGELQPCLLNGTLVDGIEYNLKTGRVNAKIAGPGSLQMKR